MNKEKKILWIDLDGTLNPFIDITNNKVTIKEWNIPGRFIKKNPLYIVLKAVIGVLSPSEYEYHILSQAPNNQAILEKNDWLDNYFPVNYKNRHYIEYPTNDDKAGYILNYCIKNNIHLKNCTILEDTHKHLFECEKIGIKAMHISTLISLYEESLNKKEKIEIINNVKKRLLGD